ncbi:hypothetical protein HKD37_13G036960 [Glycine soja]
MNVFTTRDDVLHWTHFVVYDIGFTTIIMRSNIDIGNSGRTSYSTINANSSSTMKQVYNARYAYRSSIRDNNTEIQQLMKLLEQDQLKDEDVVCDIFWSHSDAVKLTNVSNLVFFIDSTYKTNKYRLSLLDIVGVTPTEMTFSDAFVYLEGEHINNVIWALERFQ